MANLGERGAQNDHALRDQVVKIPWLRKTTIGPGGFRFMRIDNADPKIAVQLSQPDLARHLPEIRPISRANG